MSEEEERATLLRQIAVLNERLKDATQHTNTREGKLQNDINSLKMQNDLLQTYTRNLDKSIKKLSLVHSQMTACPNYKLAKPDIDEIVRLISNI